jgi:hypothetical protein
MPRSATIADTYTDWDVRQLEASLLETFAAEDEPPKDLTTPFGCARVSGMTPERRLRSSLVVIDVVEADVIRPASTLSE